MTPGHPSPPDILRQPRWRPDDLGLPLPPSPHANSVCLPTWQDVIGYEEQDPRVIGRLQTGYPRFFLHPLTKRFFDECGKRFAGHDEFCHAYPSRAAADRSLASVRRWCGSDGRIERWAERGPFVTCLPASAENAARKHWRHAGEGISSRCAEAMLTGQAEVEAGEAKRAVRDRIAGLVGVPLENVYLFSSGMSAIYTVYRAVQHLFGERRSVQFGFPYVDTLKIQQEMGPGAFFYARGDQGDLDALSAQLNTEPISAVYCEFPSNPLLASPDLASLARLGQQHNFPLVVDETLGNYVNVDLLPVADVLTTSLTKYFSGAGDVMGGAAIVNPGSRFAARLQQAIDGIYEDTLWGDDALLLARHSADFADRMHRVNHTAEQVCDFCRSHATVADVCYPKYRTPDAYRAFQRPEGGYGGLFSLLLKDPRRNARRFYDTVRLCKGPNLGAYFTLCCPFTLLAHFDELDFVESCGVSRHLIRISVGLEPPDDLIERIGQALG